MGLILTTEVVTAGPLQQASGEMLRVLSITPSGEDVPPGRQIVIQFDRGVVPVGRMERDASELPITLYPPLACEWRWLNTSSLACQLGEEQALVPSTQYTLVLRPGIETQDGATLSEDYIHHFITQRPKVTRATFQTWRGPGMPRIIVTLDQPVTRASLARHLFFETNRRSRIPLTAELLEENPRLKNLQWVVSPISEMRLDAQIHLKVEPGLLSRRGTELSVNSRAIVEFYTFPRPRFLGVQCSDNSGKSIKIYPGSRRPPTQGCNPLSRVSLMFSSPVTKEVLRDHLVVEPDLAGGRTNYDPWDNIYSYSRLNRPRRKGQEYTMRLPEVLKAATTYRIRASASEILDEFGRPLNSDIDFSFPTNDRPPNLVMTHRVSILERQVDTHVPVVLTNLQQLNIGFQSLTHLGTEHSQIILPVAKTHNVAYRFPLNTREWLKNQSGALFGHIKSRPSVAGPGWFFSEVTPFHVHTKLGHRNSLVWVTDLATGKPVEGAQVQIYLDQVSNMTARPTPLSAAVTNADGIASLQGLDLLDPLLEKYNYWSGLYNPLRPRQHFFVRVDMGDEMALLPMANDFSVRAEGPNMTWPVMERLYGHIRTWGTTAQGVYRAGDTIQFKIYVRDQDNQSFVAAPANGYHLQVIDPMNKVAYEVKDFELNDFGAYHGEFKVHETGVVGWYQFKLKSDFIENKSWQPMRVLVADFTPAPFRVLSDIDGELFRAQEEITISTSAKLHSGGPFGEAQTRVTVSLRRTPLRPSSPKAQGFFFDTGDRKTQTLHEREASVDAQGELETRLTLPSSKIIHGKLQIESAVRDDRGKYISGRASAQYFGHDRLVGISQAKWVLKSGENEEVLALVVDEYGKVVPGVQVTTEIQYRETKASRVKGAGNAYLTKYTHDWINFDNCKVVSGPEASRCLFTPDRPGLYRMTATIEDTLGRTHQSQLRRWAWGKGRVLWETPPGHHLPIEPEKTEYQVGETARFLIQNPFPGARALFTIERFGVQRSWSQVLESSTELIDFEITPDHLPGFYFSATVMSPRVDKPLGENDVDLGKPVFRMGYVRLSVRDPHKEITVDVKPLRTTYKPRETVRVDLVAAPRFPVDEDGRLPQMELAVAVLDEAVFDLLANGRDYFDPYKGFYRLEPLDLQNYNLLTRLVGIQKFEKKGANPGGGGGLGPDLRSIFKFVSYWNPSLLTDANGRATIEFEVPDNLTGWRVLAMAVTSGDRMGLGEGSFLVNQPTELRPALPNQVTEGDRFKAQFTVMNRTESSRTLLINAQVTGPAESPGLNNVHIEAEPYKRYTVSFPVRAVNPGNINFTIRAGDSIDEDALQLPLEVHKFTALEAAATYGTTTETEVTETIAFPTGIRTDVGRVSVVASPSVIGGVEGAFRYIRDYPYDCWEQKLTKGVMASHFKELKGYVSPDFKWEGHEALPEQTLALAASYQAPNGGMVYWVPRDSYVSPYLSAYTALAFNWLRERGYSIPTPVEAKLHGYLLDLLRKNVFPDFYSKGMASSVRAVALAALAPHNYINRSDLERYRQHIPEMDLFGKSHFLMAASTLQATDIESEVKNVILAYSNQTGGKFVFSEDVDTGFKRILYSSERANCSILSALVRQQGGAPVGTGIGDIPFKLTRSITQSRKRRDRWENTQENIFCMNALVDFSQVYEQDKPNMSVQTYLDGNVLGQVEFQDLRDPPATFEHPIQTTDPGREAIVKITKDGQGRIYYSARLFYSPRELKSNPINSGIEIRREYSVERDGEWILLQSPFLIRSGELVRVDLYVSLPAPRNFVVVDDPVPGGLEPVNRDLATASTVDSEKGEFKRSESSFWFTRDDWRAFGYSHWSFYHRELRHDSVRFYSDYLPAGNYHLSYVAQAIALGEFQTLPVHAEEMYDPDVFGQGVPEQLRIEESDQ